MKLKEARVRARALVEVKAETGWYTELSDSDEAVMALDDRITELEGQKDKLSGALLKLCLGGGRERWEEAINLLEVIMGKNWTTIVIEASDKGE